MSKIEVKVDPYYQRRAKEMVDMFFDGQMFNKSLSRDDLMAIENYLAWEFETTATSSKKITKLMARIKS